MRLLITTLAEYQTRFWCAVGLELQRRGHHAAFLSFDDRSSEMLRDAGLTTYHADRDAAIDRPDEVITTFGVERLNHWLSHERFAFGERDGAAMRRRLAAYLLAADAALEAEGETIMLQELGGFLSVIGSWFAARRRGVDNFFLEPSFFRGRLFFLENSFAAIRPNLADGPAEPEARAYLEDTVARGAIVIPEKDRHQYTTARRKIVNLRNAQRLAEKLADKYVFGKRQEFGHIGHHVASHARMIANSRRLAQHYRPLDPTAHYVYYPLHVPGDMALTLRSPEYLDQAATIDFLCRAVPATHRVAIKEHPAMVGAVDASVLLRLKRRYDNLDILPPATNNYDVLRRADLVVSVNSKSGAEAGLVGLPVLVLGDAFYADAPFVTPVARLADLPAAIETALAGPGTETSAVSRFFDSVWRLSYPGELYVEAPANIATFVDSLERRLA